MLVRGGVHGQHGSMTTDNTEPRARELYEAQEQPEGSLLPAWENAPEAIRNAWRDLARGDAGAAVD